MISIPLDVISSRMRHGEPVTVGVPFPRGLWKPDADLCVVDERGAVPATFFPTAFWSDGSVKWCLLDTYVSSGRQYRVAAADNTATPRSGPTPIRIVESQGGTAVDNGLLEAQFIRNAPWPLASVRVGGTDVLRRTDVTVVTSSERTLRPLFGDIVVTERTPLRSVIESKGTAHIGRMRVELDARFTFRAGVRFIRCDITVRNPHRATHSDGYWELGDPASFLFRDLSVHLTLAGNPRDVSFSLRPDAESVSGEIPFELVQTSSGGCNTRSRVHVTREGRIASSGDGYQVRTGSVARDGARATPVVTIGSDIHRTTVVVRRFWEEFPKAIVVSGPTVRLGLFPAGDDLHELQGGEQKTHQFTLAWGDDSISEPPWEWCRTPAVVRCPPDWYCGTGVVHDLHTEAGTDPRYNELVRAGIAGDRSFFVKREQVDEYGWRHFGEIYADHEAIGASGSSPLISHYNNQYDALAAFLCQFMRTGDPRWWELADPLARHVADIDIYHTTEDRAAYNHGLFWHTAHYTDCGLSSHRSYPRGTGLPGGGPSSEHNYSTGFLLHYYLTGSAQSRDAVLELAQWTRDMENGRLTPFRWIDGGDTGLSTRTAEDSYHGPGRGAGNSIQTLLNAYQLTADREYLEHAERLIRRCIHPDDDIPARKLLEPERRWSYTVFLRALAAYIGVKEEGGATDTMYHWAVESLRHYARWMARNEYSYLDKPELLEFPNETWAAQDLRKAAVLFDAARRVAHDEAEQMRDKAQSLFIRALDTLAASRYELARPLVILAAVGWVPAWHSTRQSMEDAPGRLPAAAPDFGVPAGFIPQKARILSRLPRFVLSLASRVGRPLHEATGT